MLLRQFIYPGLFLGNIFFLIATDFCLFTQECQFQEKKRAIFWWTNIFRERAQKAGKSGY